MTHKTISSSFVEELKGILNAIAVEDLENSDLEFELDLNDFAENDDLDVDEDDLENELADDIQHIDEMNRSWIDISSEEYRVYQFASDNGDRIDLTIKDPVYLCVGDRPNAGHRIYTADGISHYIPQGWICISWKGSPPFVA